MAGQVQGAPFLSRAWQFVLFLFSATITWCTMLWNIDSFPAQCRFFIKISPLWFIVTVGALSLGNIGFHLFTFRDCPEAFRELQQQIKEAKTELIAKGVRL